MSRGKAPRKRQWLRTDERRPQLLQCAVRVFARRGFDRGAHAEVARESGVAVATVFAYFPAREQLVDGVLGEVDRYMIALVERSLGRRSTTREVLFELADDFSRTIDTDPDYVRVWLSWSTAIGNPIWPRWVELQERIIRKIAATIRAGQRAGDVSREIDAASAARIYAGEAHMVALLKFAHTKRRSIDWVLQHVVESALRVPSPAPRPRSVRPLRVDAAAQEPPALLRISTSP